MTALAKNTERKSFLTAEHGPTGPLGCLTNVRFYIGSICVTTTAGLLAPATQAVNLKAQGVSEFELDTTGVASNTIRKGVTRGPHEVENSGTDPVTNADIGNVVFIEDDNTCRRTNPGGNTTSPMGPLAFFSDAGKPVVLIGVGF